MAVLKAILLDHDGTLVNSEAIHFELWRQLLHSYDVELTAAYYNKVMAGVSVLQNGRDVIRDFGVATTPEQLFDGRRSLTLEYLKKQAFPLMPGAKETLSLCHKKGYRLAIVTGGARASVERTIASYGFSDWIECIVSFDDVTRGKPDPECYLQALKLMRLEASAAVAIEDTEYGLAAAFDAGIRCAAIPTPLSLNHDFSKASGIYNSLADWTNKEIS